MGAIVILIWHYHHFYLSEPFFLFQGDNPIWIFETQPFYGLFKFFYHNGAWAVQFFWMLSGFVFANVYLTSSITFKQFFINRFARLYPLHFITLITIAVFQYTNFEIIGHYQIVGNNDLYHFILHLFFASNWGFEAAGTYSYNSVIWSVSLEILVYGLFFLALNYIKKYPVMITLLILFISSRYAGLLSQCIFYFFTGTMTYILTQKLKHRNLLILSIGLIIIAPQIIELVGNFLDSYLSGIISEKHIGKIKDKTFTASIALFMSGGILLAAYLDLKEFSKKFSELFSWIGNNTYSTYLWHLPVQVLILFFIDYFGINRNFFNNEWVFSIWIVCMILIGRLSFLYLETPAKILIKEKLNL